MLALAASCERDGANKAEAADAASAHGAAAAAPGQASGQQLPPEIGQWVQAVRRECQEAGGRWNGISNFILRADFNGDGQTDYVLMRQGIDCPSPGGGGLGPLERLWGNAGPRNDFLVSQAGGGYRLYDGFAVNELLPDSITRRGDRDVVLLEGTWAESGGEVRKVLWGWNGSGMAVVERQDAQGRAVGDNRAPLGVADTLVSQAGFAVEVSLSPQAAARLRGREGIVVSVRYYGEPRPGVSTDDEMGLPLGSEDVESEGRPGIINVTGRGFRTDRLRQITGAPLVNVNVFTARRSSPDNLIWCQPLLSGTLAEIAGRTHQVRCALITEG